MALSQPAQAAGAQIGWTSAHVLSLLPHCHILPFHTAKQEAAWNRVLERLYALTPKVESARPGLAWCEMPLQPPLPLAPMSASQVSARADTQKRAWSQLVAELGASLEMAHDRSKAALAAFSLSDSISDSASARSIRRVAAERETLFVDNLPLETLLAGGVSEETVLRLGWFGVQRIGPLRGWTLAQFPGAKAIWRLVEAGSAQADRRPVTTWRPLPTISERRVFENAAQSPDQWERALEEMLCVLESELNGRGALHLAIVVEVRGKTRATGARTLRERVATAKRLYEPARSLPCALLGEGDELEAFTLRLSGLQDES